LNGIKFKYFILKLISWVRAQFIYSTSSTSQVSTI